MFTGIVEEIGAVQALEQRDGGWQLDVKGGETTRETALGDSIAVNGVCLTVTRLEGGVFTFGLAPETLARTNLGDLKPGAGVNLERSLRADGRLGGHFVQGHVDGTGVLKERREDGDSLVCTIQSPAELLHYMVPKGFIAVDGTSLTIIDVLDDYFTFMLVAYTQQHIVLPRYELGARINIEVDLLAKYAEKFMAAR
ncbi:MAG: riboflavin synthase [Deltaproteobacteria bacterium]|nr:riboflavin synthase [Deltaproteobacteria bacterium]